MQGAVSGAVSGAGSGPERRELLTADAVRAWVRVAMDLLTQARSAIDRANVFPVADSDTGTNMWLTLAQGRDAVDGSPAGTTAADLLTTLARGALLGARGNSGVILSEYLRGFAAAAAAIGREDGSPDAARAMSSALSGAARCAYDAVADPRRGTILTAADGAAEAARAAVDAGADVAGVVEVARAGAHDALLRSPGDLEVLRDAGVLDAGAYGLVLVLDALALAVGTKDVSVPRGSMPAMRSLHVADSVRPDEARPDGPALRGDRNPVGEPGDGGERAVDGEFEVMYVIEHVGDEKDLDRVATSVRAELEQIGDSVVVVGGALGLTMPAKGLWQVHIHTDRPLDALRTGRRWTQRQIVVRSLVQQLARGSASRTRDHDGGASHDAPAARAVGVVACTASPGLVMDLARAGAVVVLRGSVPVAQEDLVRAAQETRAGAVVLLPADEETLAVARRLAEDHAQPAAASTDGLERLSVVESVSDLHVVAAMAQWAMMEDPGSARSVRAAVPTLREVVRSVRARRVSSPRSGGAVSQEEVADALAGLLDGVTGDEAILTVLIGDLVPPGDVDTLVRRATQACPGIGVVVLPSGRESSSIVLGVD